MNRFIVLMLCFWSQSMVFAQTFKTNALDGQLYVKLRDDVVINEKNIAFDVNVKTFPHLKSVVEKYQINRIRSSFYFSTDSKLRRTFRIYFSQHGQAANIIKALQASSEVEYAEYVPLLKKSLTPNDLGPNSTTNTGQWFLHRINAQAAWDISTGDQNIKVAVVDDAVMVGHADLSPNILPGRDVSLNTSNPAPPNDNYDHGTHVAGIVSARSNNGLGISSIGYTVKIIPVKATNDPQFVTDGYEGITWSAQNGADVINMSWGSDQGGTTGQNVINAASNLGCVLVAAAGNDGVSSVFYPAGYNNVISVASTTSTDTKSSFSNFGSWIKISAPGSSIRSTIVGGDYGFKSGTSMASPLVAGLCGLILSVNPSFTPTQVLNCLQSSATNINSQNSTLIGQLGAGRINAAGALQCANSSLLPIDGSIFSITSPNGSFCQGALSPTFVFRNAGTTAITTANFTYQLNTQTPQSFPWTGNLASGAVTTITLPQINPPVGNHTLTINLSNTINSNQTDGFAGNNTNTSAFTILSNVGISLPFTENFEGTFNTNNWLIENTDNDLGWEIVNVGGSQNGTKAAKLDFFNYTAIGQRDAMITRTLNFAGYSSINMTFQHAYRRFDSSSTDSLIVYITTNCGQTYTRLLSRGESGSGSFATAGISNTSFTPALSTDWCFDGTVGSACYTINLTPFAGQSNVRLRFEAYNNFGNNLFLDNINITGVPIPMPPQANFSASGNESVCEGSSVSFTNQSLFSPTTYQWSFPGGSPATSSSVSPNITYQNPGNYSVTLIANNAQGSDTFTLENYITVLPKPTLAIQASDSATCRNTPVTLQASGASAYNWFPVVGLSSSTNSNTTANPSQTTTYTLNGTGANGCVSLKTITITINQLPTAPVIGFDEATGTITSNVNANQYQWLLAGNPIGGATTPTWFPTTNGSYRLRITDQNGCSNQSNLLTISTVSIADISKIGLKIYPNPANQMLYFESPFVVVEQVKVIDALGRIVLRGSVSNNQLDLSNMATGAYILELTHQNKNYHFRFIKQ